MSICSIAAYSSLDAALLSHTGFVPVGDKDDITPDQSAWRKPQFTGSYIRHIKKPCTVPSARVVLPVGNRRVSARWQDVDECPHAQLQSSVHEGSLRHPVSEEGKVLACFVAATPTPAAFLSWLARSVCWSVPRWLHCHSTGGACQCKIGVRCGITIQNRAYFWSKWVG